jgi:hypothetical protein
MFAPPFSIQESSLQFSIQQAILPHIFSPIPNANRKNGRPADSQLPIGHFITRLKGFYFCSPLSFCHTVSGAEAAGVVNNSTWLRIAPILIYRNYDICK